MVKEVESEKRISLFTKYYIAIAATVIASLIILGTIFSFFLYDYWKEKNLDDLLSNSVALSAAITSENNGESLEEHAKSGYVSSIINVYKRTDGNDTFVIDNKGRMLNQSDASVPVLPKGIFLLTENLGRSDTYVNTVDWDEYGGKCLVAINPIIIGGTKIGAVVSVKPAKAFFSFVDNILRLFAFSALASLVVSVGVAYYLVYRVYKPISQLKEATKHIGAGDYSYRVKIDGENEFAYLGAAFNKMADDLSALESSRRNFIANVSHELKTPMTTIGGYIDAIMDGTISADKQDHYLQIVSTEVKRLSRLVVAMLNLSKIEAGERKLSKKEVNLSSMLFEVVLSFEQRIEQNNIEVIGLESIGDINATVDSDMIYQVFYNLVDNAVKFTDNGGRIALHLSEHNGKAVFRIINECSGITKEDLDKIFERFYKVDRSRHYDTQSFGLGLYIAKTIVGMHGGQITARSTEGKNCEFLFWIPTGEF